MFLGFAACDSLVSRTSHALRLPLIVSPFDSDSFSAPLDNFLAADHRFVLLAVIAHLDIEAGAVLHFTICNGAIWNQQSLLRDRPPFRSLFVSISGCRRVIGLSSLYIPMAAWSCCRNSQPQRYGVWLNPGDRDL